MSPVAIAAACLARVLLNDAVFYDASVHGRMQTQVRSGAASDGLSFSPRLDLRLDGRRYSLSGVYAPQLLLRDPAWRRRDSDVELHGYSSLGLGGVYRMAAEWDVDAALNGSYGRRDLLFPLPGLVAQGPVTGAPGGGTVPPALPGAGPAPAPATGPVAGPVAQPLPADTTVQYASLGLLLGTSFRVAPTAVARIRAGALLEGGATARARASLPLQHAGTLDATLRWRTSARDELALAGSSTVSRFLGSEVDRATLATDSVHVLTLGWARDVSRGLGVTAALGPTATTEYRGGALDSTAGVAASAGVQKRLLGRGIDLTLEARSAPVVDRVTSNVYDRGDVVGGLRWDVAPRWAVSGAASYGRVLEGRQRGDELTSAQGAVLWTGTETWGVTGGVGYTDQTARLVTLAASPRTSLRVWEVYLGVTLGGRGRLWPN